MSQIIEIAFDVQSQEEFDFLELLLARIGIAHYYEPKRKDFKTLEDVEAACEGK